MSGADGDEQEERANGELSPPSYESLDPGTPPPYSSRTLGLFGTASQQRLDLLFRSFLFFHSFPLKPFVFVTCSFVFLGLVCFLDIPEAPPDYFAVVQRIQHARNESQTCCDFFAKALHLIVCAGE